ncbi:MAG TPA: cupredoxin domain-containing protein [Stellaceae bacterium]
MRYWSGVAFLAAGLLLPALSLARAEDPSFPITIKDHRFEPAELQVPAGVKVKLVIRNSDPTPEEFESRTLHREKVIPGGGEGTVFVGPLGAGTYDFFGDFNPKTAQGRLIAK